jgi:pimeloyl-ACP methyl ester carboxylesterase
MGFPAALPDSELATIDDAAHMCHFEKPEVWSQHIRTFLAGT